MGPVIRIIDSISEYMGRVMRWVCLILVLVLTYEVTARYVFNAPTIWAHETSRMLGATIASLGWAYVHRHHGHVRVDAIYAHLSQKGRTIVDIVCTLLFLLPLIIILAYTAAERFWFSFSMSERLLETYWYPPAAPIRLVVFIGLCIFAFQGIAQLIRNIYLLMGRETTA
jgi:TRAP-type mannitol/chloroaromatic compound transport system permease small subunit